MKQTHPEGKIVQFHHSSDLARRLLSKERNDTGYVVLQLEAVEHKEYDFIAEIIQNQNQEPTIPLRTIQGYLDELKNSLREG